MTGKTNVKLNIFGNQSQYITLKIWFKTGEIFQEIFSIDQTTFAHVKYLSMQYHLLDEIDNYKLISIQSKRTINEQKTLRQEKVKDGDEYLLIKKLLSKVEQISEPCPIDEKLIENRTENLPLSLNLFSRTDRLTRRNEFRTDLNRILLILIETTQKLLWYRSDAEQIFKQAEEILSKSTISNAIEIHPYQINKLVDMGFTEQQAQIALKRTNCDVNAAMELLLIQPDINDNENKITSFYSHNGPFIPFRKFRQQYFQPNPTTIQSLKEMGFNHDDIISALQICHNDQNIACDYLIADKQQQKNMIDADNEQSLDENSNMFQIIMDNPIVQRTLNNPKTFFIMLQLYENPNLITTYINDPDIGNMLLQISRIYHAERYQMNIINSNQQDERNSSTMTNGDFENNND